MITGLEVSSGAPSAEAWAFFSVITAGVLTIIGQQVKARYDAKLARIAAERAVINTEQAVANTANVSNGFVGRVDRKLDRISEQVADIDKDFRDHLEWHVSNPPQTKER